MKRPRNSRNGFSRLDLMAALGSTVFLLALLTGSTRAIEAGSRIVVCSANLQAIGQGMAAFAEQNAGQLHRAPNHGRWDNGKFRSWSDEFTWINRDNQFAYWGVAYRAFVDGGHERFRCPEAGDVDDWYEFNQERYKFSTYGLNGLISGANPSGYASPDKVILAQDAPEQKMEGQNDTLGKWPGAAINLPQWRWNMGWNLYHHYPEGVGEWFRHGRPKGLNSEQIDSGDCVTLWADGHVAAIPYTGEGDYRWYTGE